MNSGAAGGMNSGAAGGMNSGAAGGMNSGAAGGMNSGAAGGMNSGAAGGMNSGRGVNEGELAAGLAQWAIWDIAPTMTQLPANVAGGQKPLNVPGAKQVRGLPPFGLAGGNNYAGPCPGRTTHLYEFKIYALGVSTLPGARTDGRPAAIVDLIETAGAVLGSATLNASYTGQ
jgi:hypothetical protein